MKACCVLFLLVFLAATPVVANSSSLADFDKSFAQLRNEDLRVALLKVITQNHRYLDYAEARRHLFGSLHLEQDAQGHYVKDVYCRKEFRGAQVGPMKIPNANLINCEHTWPQSKFNPSKNPKFQKSDLHHLFPADNHANSVRGNYPFAVVDGSPVARDCGTSRLGSPVMKSGGDYFEPPEEHRGNVARALFYFAVRYEMALDDTQEAFLRRWHEEDPVDADEIERNQKVLEIQGNSNPFIDRPELVEAITNF